MTTEEQAIQVSPDVLVWARESAGLTLAAAAHMARRSEASVRAYESGSAKPSVATLRELARAYRRPLVALLLSRPRAEKLPTDFRVGRLQEPLTRQSLLALRRARRLQLVANELEGKVRFDQARFHPGALSVEEAEGLAMETRRLLRISIVDQAEWKHLHHAFSAWRHAVEDQGVLVFQMQMPIDELRGFSYPDPLPPVISLNTSDYIGSRIFSLFHELAHLFLGEGGICDPDTGRYSSAANQIERFCNRFAGATLVPVDALLAKRDVVERLASGVPPDSVFTPLTSALRVSRPVILYRLRDLGYVDDHVFEAKWSEWSVQWERLPQASKGPALTRAERRLNERGEGFVNGVLKAEEQGRIPESAALDYLDLQKGELLDIRALLET